MWRKLLICRRRQGKLPTCPTTELHRTPVIRSGWAKTAPVRFKPAPGLILGHLGVAASKSPQN